MKTRIITLLLLISMAAHAQLQIGVEFDPVINTIGSALNPDTEHDPLLAYGVSVGYKAERNIYINMTYNYVNLAQKYNSISWGLGAWLDGNTDSVGQNSKFDYIAWLGMELIQRELIPVDEFDARQDPVSISGSLNGMIQYEFTKGWHLMAKMELELASDIEGKLLRPNGSLGITKDLF